MKKFVLIIGGQAAGKMTVGEELAKITSLKLFHAHMSIELAHHFYGFSTYLEGDLKARNNELFKELRDEIRRVVFFNLGKSYFDGVISTALMHFDRQKSLDDTQEYMDIFAEGAMMIGEKVEYYCVELVCDKDERHKRNVTQNRLEKKPSKRNTEWTKGDIEKSAALYRIVSTEEDRKSFPIKNYIQIDNTNLSAEEAAVAIKEQFSL